MKNHPLKKLIAVLAMVCSAILTSAPRLAVAEEGGSGHYFPGSMSDFADAVPLSPTFIVRYNQPFGSRLEFQSRRRTAPARPRMPEPNSMMLPGSGTVPVVVVLVLVVLDWVPRTVNDSEGIVPTPLSEAEDGPEF